MNSNVCLGLVAFFALLALTATRSAEAGVREDESILRAHFLCGKIFSDRKLTVYEKDKVTPKSFHSQLMSELGHKYSRSDSDTMIVKTMLESEHQKTAKEPVQTCRDFYSILRENKTQWGRVLSHD